MGLLRVLCRSRRYSILQCLCHSDTNNLMLQDCRRQIIDIKAVMDAGETKQSARTTIFHQLLTPNVTEGYVIPTVNDLKDEAYNLVAAASETVGGALTTATYQVVSNK